MDDFILVALIQMIIDACIFAGELDMLKFRMAILAPVVDYFVVVENAWTHQGQTRERSIYNQFEYQKVLSFYLDIHIDGPRATEIAHREAIVGCCAEFADDDLVILSDVDEIPSREFVEVMSKVSEPSTCELDFYYYRLNWRRPEKCGLVMSTIKHLRKVGGEAFRTLRGNTPYIFNKPSGWHLSYFGGTQAIQKKLQSFCHPEFNKPEFLDAEWLDKCQLEGIALLKCGTPFTKVTPADFPQYFLDAAPESWWL